MSVPILARGSDVGGHSPVTRVGSNDQKGGLRPLVGDKQLVLQSA